MSTAGRRLGLRRRSTADAARTRRVDDVLGLVERFVYDLGLLTAGADVDIESYVEGPAAQRLRHAVGPATGGDVSTRPDFGEYAQVRIEGDLLDDTATVFTVVELDDRSTRVNSQGQAVTHLRRRLRLLLVLDSSLRRVVDHRLAIR